MKGEYLALIIILITLIIVLYYNLYAYKENYAGNKYDYISISWETSKDLDPSIYSVNIEITDQQKNIIASDTVKKGSDNKYVFNFGKDPDYKQGKWNYYYYTININIKNTQSGEIVSSVERDFQTGSLVGTIIGYNYGDEKGNDIKPGSQPSFYLVGTTPLFINAESKIKSFDSTNTILGYYGKEDPTNLLAKGNYDSFTYDKEHKIFILKFNQLKNITTGNYLKELKEGDLLKATVGFTYKDNLNKDKFYISHDYNGYKIESDNVFKIKNINIENS